MNLQQYRQLQAERGTLEKLLADLPADRVIERIGLEARKQEINAALAAQPAPAALLSKPTWTSNSPGREPSGTSKVTMRTAEK